MSEIIDIYETSSPIRVDIHVPFHVKQNYLELELRLCILNLKRKERKHGYSLEDVELLNKVRFRPREVKTGNLTLR